MAEYASLLNTLSSSRDPRFLSRTEPVYELRTRLGIPEVQAHTHSHCDLLTSEWTH